MADQEGWKEAFHHIVHYLPSRKWDTAEMLVETVAGVMAGLDLDAPPTPAPNIQRSRSLRERWSKLFDKTVR